MPITKVERTKMVFLAAILLLAMGIPLLLNHQAHAATLSRVLVRFDRMKVSTPTTGTICARPTTAATEASMQIDFPTGYTVSTTAANWTVDTTVTTGWPTGGVAWLGIATATAAVAQTVTFPSSDLVVGTLYCFNWTNTVALSVKAGATSDNAGVVRTRDGATSTIDSASFATASIADDQIVVTASVPQTFSFAISANTDSLGSLSSGSVSSSPTPRTATVNTNAKNGWYVWGYDSSTGLNSSSAASTIASTTPGSNSTLVAGTAGYNTGVTQTQAGGTGTITVAVPFVGGLAGKGGGLDTTVRTMASSTGTATNAVLTLTNNAAITTSTPAATDYTDTITVVGAGLF